MQLVAIDIEGSGAQDRENEAILEIALVPIVDWRPDVAAAYHTLIDPQRTISPRPWISPGLTDATLREAPALSVVEPEILRIVAGRYLVGHNVGVDWRLLRRKCPAAAPAGLIDTVRLSRHVAVTAKHDLNTLVEHFGLVDELYQLAAGSRPHRALWDAIAVGCVLPLLGRLSSRRDPSVELLIDLCGVPLAATRERPAQPSLFE